MKSKYLNMQYDNNNVKCKLYTHDNGKIENLVIFGHGFAGHKDNKAAERLANKLISKNKGFALLAFDLPCHGEDVKKRLTLDDCINYYDIVVKGSKEMLGAQKLYINATSFGAFLVLKYISEIGNPFEKMVFRSPAVNMYKVITTSLITPEIQEKLDKNKDAAIGFDRKVIINRQFIEDLKNTDLLSRDFMDYADDILILHGTKDEIAPFEDSQKFSENNVIDFIPIEGADHRYKDINKMEYANALAVDFY